MSDTDTIESLRAAQLRAAEQKVRDQQGWLKTNEAAAELVGKERDAALARATAAEGEVERANAEETRMHGECAKAWSAAKAAEEAKERAERERDEAQGFLSAAQAERDRWRERYGEAADRLHDAATRQQDALERARKWRSECDHEYEGGRRSEEYELIDDLLTEIDDARGVARSFVNGITNEIYAALARATAAEGALREAREEIGRLTDELAKANRRAVEWLRVVEQLRENLNAALLANARPWGEVESLAAHLLKSAAEDRKEAARARRVDERVAARYAGAAEAKEYAAQRLRRLAPAPDKRPTPPPGDSMTPDQEKALRAELAIAKARLLEEHRALLNGADAAEPIGDDPAVDTLEQLRTWVRSEKARCKSEGAIFDSGFRCVSEGGEIFYFDPESVERALDERDEARTALAAAQGVIDAAIAYRKAYVGSGPADHQKVQLAERGLIYAARRASTLAALNTSGKPGGEAQAGRVWGTCGDCPRDPNGRTYPHYCEHRGRHDHQLEWPIAHAPPEGHPAPRETMAEHIERMGPYHSICSECPDPVQVPGHPAPACRDCGAIGIGVYPGMCDRCGGNGSAPAPGHPAPEGDRRAICPKGHVTETPLDEGCHFKTGEYQDEVFDVIEHDGKKVPVGERVYLCCGEPVTPAPEGKE